MRISIHSTNRGLVGHLATEEDEQDDDTGAEGTFVDYVPKKLRIGKKHPGAVVETSVLARAVPPDIR